MSLGYDDAIVICHNCGGEMSPTELELEGERIRGWQCPKCGEKIPHPTDRARVLAARRKPPEEEWTT